MSNTVETVRIDRHVPLENGKTRHEYVYATYNPKTFEQDPGFTIQDPRGYASYHFVNAKSTDPNDPAWNDPEIPWQYDEGDNEGDSKEQQLHHAENQDIIQTFYRAYRDENNELKYKWAHVTQSDLEHLNGNIDQPYDSAWDQLVWTDLNDQDKLHAGDEQHNISALANQNVAEDLWEGRPNDPIPTYGFSHYLMNANPATVEKYKSWFYAGAHMTYPTNWITFQL